MVTTEDPTAATDAAPSTQQLINNLFDACKQHHGYTSDAALARHLGVPDIYISRWRRGLVDTSTIVLLPLALHYAPALPVAPEQIAA